MSQGEIDLCVVGDFAWDVLIRTNTELLRGGDTFGEVMLMPEAQAVINDAANYAKSGNATQVVVVGHTDTSGSLTYNVRLSERRAKAVADALVGMGVAQTALSVDWKGETMPAVATGDGVKEPLNRRSTIDINF